MLLGLCALWRTEPIAAWQTGGTKDSCNAVRAAYKATFAAGVHTSIANSGAVNVTEAQGDITSDGRYQQSCQYLRDESVNGEPASVYSSTMKAKAGVADAKVWISKKAGLVLQQEVDVDMGAKGKGHQSMKFEYKKK
jgi:hypothetical protein